MSDLLKNHCILILLSLKESNLIFSDLIRLIVYYMYHSFFNHRLIFYDVLNSSYNNYMRLGWNNIQSNIRENYPYMSLYHIKDTTWDNIPITIRNLMQWNTMIMFIPNGIWNLLKDTTKSKYTSEVKIYNGYVESYDNVKLALMCNFGEIESYWTWVQRCITISLFSGCFPFRYK